MNLYCRYLWSEDVCPSAPFRRTQRHTSIALYPFPCCPTLLDDDRLRAMNPFSSWNWMFPGGGDVLAAWKNLGLRATFALETPQL